LIGRAAMTLAAARFGMLGTPEANEREPRQLAALGRATVWLNSPHLSATSLLGKVVLVQFGTYTCINWLRTLPYVRAWAQKYRQGLAVIGVHTPEFAFEKNLDNVRRAVQQMKIDHPIAVDNDYAIWRAFDNRYWPALYFIDARGRLRRQHFGEGEYQQSEIAIQELLAETGARADAPGVVSVRAAGVELPADWQNVRSPEIYLGHDRTDTFSSPGGAALGRRRVYAAPTRLDLNRWALAGEWTMTNQAAVLNNTGGRIVCRFHARDVHLVMGPLQHESAVRFRVTIDGQPPGPAHGLEGTTGVAAPFANSGSISSSGNRGRSSIAHSRSSSSMTPSRRRRFGQPRRSLGRRGPAWRHSHSRSADACLFACFSRQYDLARITASARKTRLPRLSSEHQM
jgi:thiol-disulfide isomerase/thioredoxin